VTRSLAQLRLPPTVQGILASRIDRLSAEQKDLLLQLALGPALLAVKGWGAPEAERAYTRARELCERAGDPPELFRALLGLWYVYLVRAQFRTAYELAGQLLRRAQSAHDPTLLVYAHHALGETAFETVQLLLAREHLEMALSLYNRERHQPLTFRYHGFDVGVWILGSAACTLWLLGYPDQALARGNEALALANALSHPLSLASARGYVVGILRQFRGEIRETQETAEGATALCAEHGFAALLALATILRGWAVAEQGRHEEGIAQIQEGFAAYRATGSDNMRPYFLSLLAEACVEAGRLDEGLTALTPTLGAEMHRLKGELLLKQDDIKAAEAQSCFERAIEIAHSQSAKSWELRATMSLARLLAKQRHRDEARTMLADIYNWFTEGFDTADLIDAKALLEELSIV
jgi:predicted ATPase